MVVHRQSERLDMVFSALADPTRRAILANLTSRAATISEIAGPFRISLNAVSKHVMVLERAGLLRREIKGREHYCSVEASALREAQQWLEHQREFWEERMDALENYVAKKLKTRKRKRYGNDR